MTIPSFARQAAVASCLIAITGLAHAQRNLYVPGQFQSELVGQPGDVDGVDWTPPTAPLMTETSSGSGVYELDLNLMYGTNGNLAGTNFGFKVLDDLSGNGANWGNADDPEVTPKNVWFNADADGLMTITLDTNEYNDGYSPTTNRIIIADDVTNWTVVGNFQSQLGGGSDWNNADASTAMTDMGGGLFQLNTTIPTPGAYVFRTVNTGSWNGIGTDGRNVDAANLAFNTFEVDQEVTFEVNTAIGGFRFLTEAVLAGDTNNNGVVEFADFEPIRDNFLTATNLRSEGDLDLSGFVDIRDFREWKNAFNGPPALIAQALSQLGGAVPEPSSLLLLATVASAFGVRRRNG